jgi:hypothetical protein
MSIFTNQYFDIPGDDGRPGDYGPPNKTTKRRFFQSAARWDETIEEVLVGRAKVDTVPRSVSLGALMEGGGRHVDGRDDEDFS